MPSASAQAVPIELRDLPRTLSHMNNQELIKVVALIDSMAQRGAFDDLIAPMRPRIAELNPCLLYTSAKLRPAQAFCSPAA